MYEIWYHIPGKTYDYLTKETWSDVLSFLEKSQVNIDHGMTYEIKRSL